VNGPLLVTGGTGVLGRLVVPWLLEAGQDVRVLSRTRHQADGATFVTGDLATGDGIASAVEGVRTIVHLAGSPKGDEVKARHLVKAGARAGTEHLVYISVVGADRVPVQGRMDRAMFGYFAAKLAAERIIAASGIPFTTLRATQFHDLVLKLAQQLARMPVIPSFAGFRAQPIDAADVAARLGELALAEPAGPVPDMGGPRGYPLAELYRSYFEATGQRRLILPLPVPGRAARAFRAGANLAPEHAVQGRTWEEFLAANVAA